MKRKKKKIIPYTEEKYKKIPPIYLIVFGIYSIAQKGGRCTFEKLVAECFKLFPSVFSLSRHPEWPDSLKLDRSLRTLREKGLITGNPNITLSLTKFGEEIAKNTANNLKTGLFQKTITEKPKRDAEINWINSLKRNEGFRNFLKDRKNFSIINMELRHLLRCTMETPTRIVKQNLSYSINLAKEFGEKDLLRFLELCQRRLNKK